MSRLVCLVLLGALVGCHAIYDGDIAKIETMPWMVSVKVDRFHRCGGSIISENWILTAANCIATVKSAREVSVEVGSDNKDDGKVHHAQAIITHPKYNASTGQYDIALIQLKTTLTLRKPNLNAVKLVDPDDEPYDGETLTVAGFGIGEDFWNNNGLKAVKIPVVSRESCNDILGSQGRVIDETTLCAGKQYKGTCGGDEGGAIVNFNNFQVGIASLAVACEQHGIPGVGVYTNLANKDIRSWIKTQTGK